MYLSFAFIWKDRVDGNHPSWESSYFFGYFKLQKPSTYSPHLLCLSQMHAASLARATKNMIVLRMKSIWSAKLMWYGN
jgi:hypothetical protein